MRSTWTFPAICTLILSPLSSLCFAQNVVEGGTGSEINDCPHLPHSSLWPPPDPSRPRVLRQRDLTPSEADVSTASSFEAWRDLHTARTVELAACAGHIQLARVGKPNHLHLTITLKSELPKGITVGSFIQQFEVQPDQARIFVKVPKKYQPQIVLEVPNSTSTAIELGDGWIEPGDLEGDKSIRLARGDLLLRENMNPQYKTMKAAFGMGGVSQGSRHLETEHVWRQAGKGVYTLDAGFGFGYLELRFSTLQRSIFTALYITALYIYSDLGWQILLQRRKKRLHKRNAGQRRFVGVAVIHVHNHTH